VSEAHDELDRALAEGLRRAAQGEPYPVLDDAARERVLRALSASSVRSERRARPWVIASAVAIAAAVSIAFLRPEPAPPAVCGLPPQARFLPAGERSELTLGAHGRVVSAPDTRVRVLRSDACSLELMLEHGSLAADLHDLRPARVRVQTPLGTVEVRGTTFSVAFDRELEVVLLEGTVELTQPGAERVRLTPGHSARRARGRTDVTGVLAQQRAALHALLHPPEAREAAPGPAPVPDAAPESTSARPESATELLVEAERARREGDRTRARAHYRRASRAVGGDAEVALLRWARMELEDARAREARAVLRHYRARHGHQLERARFGAEAIYLEIEILNALGAAEQARARRAELLRRYPDSPQAKAAQAWPP
jgi:hypothetical protein